MKIGGQWREQAGRQELGCHQTEDTQRKRDDGTPGRSDLGALLGGIAGAIGGWWAGRAVVEAASSLSHEDEAYFREHYDNVPNRAADRAYDDVRPAYYLGQIASHNPNFLEREFTEVEPELERGWSEYSDKHGAWITVRDCAAEGFRHGRSKLDESARRAIAEQSGRTANELDDRRA